MRRGSASLLMGTDVKIDVRRNILEANQQLSQKNNDFFTLNRVLAVNIMASPGAGKTSTILATIGRLGGEAAFGVIEGDIASSIDTEKIAAAGIPVVQINTGNMCHLDAPMIGKVLDRFSYDTPSILFIENVGNLVCPAEFGMGEDVNVVIASVPEGHDKPAKYPAIFIKADAILLNKIDSRDSEDFDWGRFRETVQGLNPAAPLFEISCRTGAGMENWCQWLLERFRSKCLQ
ncbi:hydrogenase nickel incorporation protein HypB [Geomonas sp. RF6]|uniref:hydrogenase nickel incorporation protein HypB n=1 Tax=Geomonas sp. RF6 TaxID=2897342 RepID=UPI001E4A8DAE|nr:hydrogenase nickel incorporation protein HypB [Geomonas sp. RF6]UFS70410.1 hydrogenase nickel incorporation protein HypB [Geomonas sp. RF6]